MIDTTAWCFCSCKRPKEECICDLKRWARRNSDWPIAKLVGSATYAQLMDVGPGLFEPFTDWRSDGNTSSSIGPLSNWNSKTTLLNTSPDNRVGGLTKEEHVPPPPNLVSTVLAEGYLTVPDLKRLLIKAASSCESRKREVLKEHIDPRIEMLIGSSTSYTHPELTLGEILVTFSFITVIVSVLIGIFVRINFGASCKFAGGCPISRRV